MIFMMLIYSCWFDPYNKQSVFVQSLSLHVSVARENSPPGGRSRPSYTKFWIYLPQLIISVIDIICTFKVCLHRAITLRSP